MPSHPQFYEVTQKRNTEPLIKSTNSFFQVNMNDSSSEKIMYLINM